MSKADNFEKSFNDLSPGRKIAELKSSAVEFDDAVEFESALT